jgi:hypothetical protein
VLFVLFMKITIDTVNDTKEDIRRAVSVLTKYLEGDNSGAVQQDVFGREPVKSSASSEESTSSGAGFVDMFGSDNSSCQESSFVNDEESSVVNSTASDVSESQPSETSEQSSGFMDMFGGDSETSSSENTASEITSNANDQETVSSAPSSDDSPSSSGFVDMFGSSPSAESESSNISEQENINNSEENSSVQQKIGSFRGTPVIKDISVLHGDNSSTELTEEQKKSAKDIVSYD